MLRTIIKNGASAPEAALKAEKELKTGMGVVKAEGGLAKLPSKETSANIYLVDKQPVPTGTNAARTYFSDYEEEFNVVAATENAVLVKFVAGEAFATDQFAAEDFASAKYGMPVAVNSEGQFVKAKEASIYTFREVMNDCGHQLVVIDVNDTAVAVEA